MRKKSESTRKTSHLKESEERCSNSIDSSKMASRPIYGDSHSGRGRDEKHWNQGLNLSTGTVALFNGETYGNKVPASQKGGREKDPGIRPLNFRRNPTNPLKRKQSSSLAERKNQGFEKGNKLVGSGSGFPTKARRILLSELMSGGRGKRPNCSDSA